MANEDGTWGAQDLPSSFPTPVRMRHLSLASRQRTSSNSGFQRASTDEGNAAIDEVAIKADDDLDARVEGPPEEKVEDEEGDCDVVVEIDDDLKGATVGEDEEIDDRIVEEEENIEGVHCDVVERDVSILFNTFEEDEEHGWDKEDGDKVKDWVEGGVKVVKNPPTPLAEVLESLVTPSSSADRKDGEIDVDANLPAPLGEVLESLAPSPSHADKIKTDFSVTAHNVPALPSAELQARASILSSVGNLASNSAWRNSLYFW